MEEIILAHMVAHYEEYEAEYRYLLHQKQQPARFRVVDLEEEELDKSLAHTLQCRDAYLKTLKDIGYEQDSE